MLLKSISVRGAWALAGLLFLGSVLTPLDSFGQKGRKISRMRVRSPIDTRIQHLRRAGRHHEAAKMRGEQINWERRFREVQAQYFEEVLGGRTGDGSIVSLHEPSHNRFKPAPSDVIDVFPSSELSFWETIDGIEHDFVTVIAHNENGLIKLKDGDTISIKEIVEGLGSRKKYGIILSCQSNRYLPEWMSRPEDGQETEAGTDIIQRSKPINEAFKPDALKLRTSDKFSITYRSIGVDRNVKEVETYRIARWLKKYLYDKGLHSRLPSEQEIVELERELRQKVHVSKGDLRVEYFVVGSKKVGAFVVGVIIIVELVKELEKALCAVTEDC